MNRSKIQTAGTLLRATLMACTLLAALPAPAEPAAGEPQAVPAYQPPLRGAPARRVGGASRGSEWAELAALAPDHTGQTSLAQPVLYWYLGKPAASRLEITVSDPAAAQPRLELALPVPQEAGLQRIDLAQHGISLTPGVEYEWFVSLVQDEAQRSADLVCGGAIVRTAPPASLPADLLKKDPAAAAFRFAEAGFWYDAFHALNEALARRPGEETLLRQRAALLEQVGLGEVARRMAEKWKQQKAGGDAT